MSSIRKIVIFYKYNKLLYFKLSISLDVSIEHTLGVLVMSYSGPTARHKLTTLFVPESLCAASAWYVLRETLSTL
jgi:hypothetical protein